MDIDQVNKFIDIYCEMAKKAFAEEGRLPEALPILVSQYLKSEKGISPPKVKKLFSLLLSLPPVIARKKIPAYFGGAVGTSVLPQADYRGIGPRVRWNIGRTVCYPTAYLLEWLENYNGVRDIE